MSKRSLLNSTALNPSSQNPMPSESPLPQSGQPLPTEIQETVNNSEASLSPDDGGHLDGILLTDDAPAANDGGASVVVGDVVPMAEWIAGFLGGFNLAGNFVQALKILPEEEGKARAAAEAIYATAVEVPSLRFLIAPQGKWIGRGVAVAMFLGPKVTGARAEIVERRAKAKALAGGPAATEIGVSKAVAKPAQGERDDERADF